MHVCLLVDASTLGHSLILKSLCSPLLLLLNSKVIGEALVPDAASGIAGLLCSALAVLTASPHTYSAGRVGGRWLSGRRRQHWSAYKSWVAWPGPSSAAQPYGGCTRSLDVYWLLLRQGCSWWKGPANPVGAFPHRVWRRSCLVLLYHSPSPCGSPRSV